MEVQAPAKRRASEGDAMPAKKMVKLTASSSPSSAAIVMGPKIVKLGSSIPTIGIDNSPEAHMDRSQRFADGIAVVSRKVSLKTSELPPPVHQKIQLGTVQRGAIKGTCQNLEKPYMRLHYTPHPSEIRPPEVLRKALSLVKQKWVSKPDYAHANEQLMSIQQDCKLQSITGDLACDAFETHIRIALERGELGDFSKCLGPLCELYHHAVAEEGTATAWSEHAHEFLAYRFLHGMIDVKDYVFNISTILGSFTPEQRRSSDVQHAIDVGKSLMANDYSTFFKLYLNAPKMAGYVMDFFVDRVREEALQIYVNSLRDFIDLHDLKVWLCFQKRKVCFRFLHDRGMKFSEDNKFLDTTRSRADKKVVNLVAKPAIRLNKTR